MPTSSSIWLRKGELLLAICFTDHVWSHRSLLPLYRQCHVLGRHDTSFGSIHVPASAPHWCCAYIVARLLQFCYPEFLRLFWDVSEKIGDAFGKVSLPDVSLVKKLKKWLWRAKIDHEDSSTDLSCGPFRWLSVFHVVSPSGRAKAAMKTIRITPAAWPFPSRSNLWRPRMAW